MPFQPDIFYEIPIPAESVVIDENAIMQWLGYEKDHTDPYILDTIQKHIKSTQYLISPKGGLIIKNIESIADGIIQIPGISLNTGKIITGQLKHAEQIAIFITTIGKEIEILSNELFNCNEMLEGYIVNLIGSEAAEASAEYIQQTLSRQKTEEGMHITNRFSPGYCNWDVAEQFLIFSQFPPTFKDVTLTDSALMEPVKSVSGIIGIGSKVKFRDYKCALCTDEKCIYRKRK